MAKGRSVAIENGGKICVRIQIILNACKTNINQILAFEEVLRMLSE